MSQKKSRRSMDDDDAREFVFGEAPPAVEPIKPDEPEPDAPEPAKKTTSKAKTQQPKGDFMSQLLNKAETKERTVRITVDLPDSLHQKLSNLSGRTRMTKADIIRGLLQEALNAVDE